MHGLVPDGFAVPAGLEHERFRLRMLTVDDVVKDFDAICDRVDRDGSTEPPFVATVAENLVDLGWHQKEFALRRSFAYTVVTRRVAGTRLRLHQPPGHARRPRVDLA